MAMIKRSYRCYNSSIRRSDRNVQCTVEEVVTFCRSAKTSLFGRKGRHIHNFPYNKITVRNMTHCLGYVLI